MTNPLRSVADDVTVTVAKVTAKATGRASRRLRLMPGPRHPITVMPAGVRVVVKHGGRVIADSSAALTLREADYPPVHYLPREDVDLSALEASGHTSYCPFKGEASYFSLAGAGDEGSNAVWSYEDPFDAVPEIKGYLAFYANRVDIAEHRLR